MSLCRVKHIRNRPNIDAQDSGLRKDTSRSRQLVDHETGSCWWKWKWPVGAQVSLPCLGSGTNRACYSSAASAVVFVANNDRRELPTKLVSLFGISSSMFRMSSRADSLFFCGFKRLAMSHRILIRGRCIWCSGTFWKNQASLRKIRICKEEFKMVKGIRF